MLDKLVKHLAGKNVAVGNPYSVVKTRDGFGVRNNETGKFKSKDTSRAAAMSQFRLLEAVAHGWKPGKKGK